MDSKSMGPAAPDAASMPFDASTVVRLQSNDADEFAEQLSDWTVELTHLRPGPFAGSFELIPLGLALICRGRYDKPMAEHCATPDGCISIGRPGRESAPLSYLGHQLQDEQVFVCGSGAEGRDRRPGRALSQRRFRSAASCWSAKRTGWRTRRCSRRSAARRCIRPARPGQAASWTQLTWIVDAVERYPEQHSACRRAWQHARFIAHARKRARRRRSSGSPGPADARSPPTCSRACA